MSTFPKVNVKRARKAYHSVHHLAEAKACFAAGLVKEVEEAMVRKVRDPEDITACLIWPIERLDTIAKNTLTTTEIVTLEHDVRLDHFALAVLKATGEDVMQVKLNDKGLVIEWDWEEDA